MSTPQAAFPVGRLFRLLSEGHGEEEHASGALFRAYHAAVSLHDVFAYGESEPCG